MTPIQLHKLAQRINSLNADIDDRNKASAALIALSQLVEVLIHEPDKLSASARTPLDMIAAL